MLLKSLFKNKDASKPTEQVVKKKRPKAGCIPYVRDNDEIKMAFMISSDASYGGSDPMISKGGVDDGESIKAGAFREAQEELGLKMSNVIKSTVIEGWSGELGGMTGSYPLTIYACEVHNMHDFDKPHYETEKIVWLTLDEYATQGRKSQLHIVHSIYQKIK